MTLRKWALEDRQYKAPGAEFLHPRIGDSGVHSVVENQGNNYQPLSALEASGNNTEESQGSGYKPLSAVEASGDSHLLPHVMVEGDGAHKDQGYGGHQHVCPLLRHVHVSSGGA